MVRISPDTPVPSGTITVLVAIEVVAVEVAAGGGFVFPAFGSISELTVLLPLSAPAPVSAFSKSLEVLSGSCEVSIALEFAG